MRFNMAPSRHATFAKFAFAALFAISFCLAYPTSTAQAKKKPAKYGTIKIQTTPAGLADLRAFAIAMVPELAGAEIENSWAGLRPGSPDGLPFIGPVPQHGNVFAAVGHSRAGVQLSLGTAQLVTEFLTNRPTCVPKNAFALDRRPVARARPTFRS